LRIGGHTVPIGPILEQDSTFFSPEDVIAISSAFEDTLQALRLVDRTDPCVLMIAKRIIELAKHGERDPARLRNSIVEQFEARPR
jgi:hypothetical protein